jgi:hypothetical protein
MVRAMTANIAMKMGLSVRHSARSTTVVIRASLDLQRACGADLVAARRFRYRSVLCAPAPLVR